MQPYLLRWLCLSELSFPSPLLYPPCSTLSGFRTLIMSEPQKTNTGNVGNINGWPHSPLHVRYTHFICTLSNPKINLFMCVVRFNGASEGKKLGLIFQLGLQSLIRFPSQTLEMHSIETRSQNSNSKPKPKPTKHSNSTVELYPGLPRSLSQAFGRPLLFLLHGSRWWFSAIPVQ